MIIIERCMTYKWYYNMYLPTIQYYVLCYYYILSHWDTYILSEVNVNCILYNFICITVELYIYLLEVYYYNNLVLIIIKKKIKMNSR